MSKLFDVEITIRSVVLADDSDHAFMVAQDSVREMVSDNRPDDIAVLCEIKSANQLVAPWNGPCIPYGGDGNFTIEFILSAQQKTTQTS